MDLVLAVCKLFKHNIYYSDNTISTSAYLNYQGMHLLVQPGKQHTDGDCRQEVPVVLRAI